MTKPWVFLFDIDGTLLKAQGAGRRAINRAFEQRFGTPGAIDHLDLQGMTDPLIFKAGLLAIGQPESPLLMASLLEQYLLFLEEELAGPETASRLPGVNELLDWLAGFPGVAVGLGTGNVEPGAWAKLRRVGLAQHFAFGGYGSDHELRSEVLRIGAQRGAARLGLPESACCTLVIGDTPRDIEAARGIDAPCLAVATGGWTRSHLESCGARLAVENLSSGGLYAELSALMDS